MLFTCKHEAMRQAILQVLVQGERCGLDVVEAVRRSSGRRMLLGMFYIIILKLEQEDLVSSRWGESTSERGGLRRRYYKLTECGKEFLRNLQTVEV